MPKHFDVSVTTTPATLDAAEAGAPLRASSVLVSAPSSNTDNILWGDATLQNQTLTPGGDPQVIPLQAFLTEVTVVAVSGTQTLNCGYTVQQ
jgi:hypothetical protein